MTVRALLSVTCILSCCTALAQQKPPADTVKKVSLGEVIISASRKPEVLDNVPSSVTVINRKTIEKDLAVTTDITEILANEVPGLAPSAQTSSNVGRH